MNLCADWVRYQLPRILGQPPDSNGKSIGAFAFGFQSYTLTVCVHPHRRTQKCYFDTLINGTAPVVIVGRIPFHFVIAQF